MDDDFELEDEGTKYFCSNKVMEAVRALGYKQQYKVFEAFFNMMVEEGLGEYCERCHMFHDSDNAIYEIDLYDPGTFFHVVRVIEPLLEKKKV